MTGSLKYLWQPQLVGGPAQPYLTPSKIHMVTTEYGENTTEPSNSYCSRQSFFMSDITSYERLHAVASCQWLVKCSLWWFSDETHYSCIDESFPDRSMHHRAYRFNLPPVQNIPPLKRRRAEVWRLVSQPNLYQLLRILWCRGKEENSFHVFSRSTQMYLSAFFSYTKNSQF